MLTQHVQPNSVEAYLISHANGQLGAREKEIVAALLSLRIGSDRAIAEYLGKSRDYVQPRISEMLKTSVLIRGEDTVDPHSKKKVRQVRLREPSARQQDLF